MRRRFIRGFAVLAITASCLGVTPVPRVHAATGACISDYSGDELNPYVSRSDALATVDLARTYTDITGACAAPGATNTISITTATGIPSFPTTNGDTGILYEACADANGPIASTIVQIGVGHRGEPVLGGPYPPSQGWKICSFLVVQAASPNDYGMEILDPDGDRTVYDYPSLPGFPAPSISGTTVTLSMPSSMCFTVDAPAPPLVGIQRTDCMPFFNGTSLQNIVARTSNLCVCVNFPFPVCVNTNPLGISCNGNQIVGPIYGIYIWVPLPLTPSDWIPGKITCATPGVLTTCSAAGTPASSPTAAGNGYDLGLVPGSPGAAPTCTNPLSPGPAVPPANNGLVTCGAQAYTWNYNPCQAGNGGNGAQDQGDLYSTTSKVGAPCPVTSATLAGEYDTDYGRIFPAQLPTVLGFAVGPTFLYDNGWNA